MSSYLFRIDEGNKFLLNKPHEANRVYYSELRSWSTRNAFRSFSLKYVLEGSINYDVNNQLYEVAAGSFLIADKRNDVKAHFESASFTKSICIDVSTNIVSEAATVMAAKEDFDFDNYLSRYFKNSVFCEKVYTSKNNLIGEKLIELSDWVVSQNDSALTDEWFLEMAEAIILQEKGNYLALNGIKSVKSSTQVETFCRLNKAKAYMDDGFLQNPMISEIAMHCNMSEFHFFRSFKQAFGITPYQYLLKKRLEFSKKMLLEKIPAKEIAMNCGFADLFTYSKAFKRIFGISPTGYLKQHD